MADSNTNPDLCVAIIACNAQRTIEQTLRSVEGLARRVIVVDSGSTDQTIEICRRHGVEIVHRARQGYARQKQLAMEQCDSAWVLSLDADESLDPDAAREVRRVAATPDPAVSGYQLNRRVWFGDLPLRHTWQPEWRTRLVRRGRAHWTGYEPHPWLSVEGPVAKIGGTIRHDAFADIAEFVDKQVRHGLQTGESYYQMGRRGSVLRLLVSPPSAIVKQLVIKGSWRDGWLGWAAAYGAGLQAAVKNMRLLELSNERSAM